MSLEKIARQASDILIFIAAIGLVLMTAIVGWQVFGRYVLGQSPDWSEQASLALMIWYIFLASAVGVREGFHIRIVALENTVYPKARHYMQIISQLVILISGLLMFVYGLQLVILTWSHAVPTLPLTRGMVYLAVPLGGLLIALFSLERLVNLVSNRQVAS